ncbi:MAG: PEP-CTERM system TPR-repeat protein PrsT [Gammaproteobacteria bacterium]|nr:PEP-CTERM system TPR-repeat protein PrsT [Gammaproteobacteria bacterium]
MNLTIQAATHFTAMSCRLNPTFHRRIWGAVFAVVLSAGIAACNSTDSNPEESIERAKVFLDEGEYRSAVIELKKALQQDSNNSETRWLLGKVYLDTGDFVSAEKEMLRAVELGIVEDSVVIPLARALLAQGKYQAVIDNDYSVGMLTQSQWSTLWALRGHAYQGLGEVDSADTFYNRALTINENESEANLGKAQIAATRGELDLARGLLDTLIEAKPEFTSAWVLLAEIEQYEGHKHVAEGNGELARTEFEKAIISYSEVLKHNPNNLAALSNRATLYIITNKMAEAKKDISGMKSLSPDFSGGHFATALVSYAEGETAQAEDALQRLMSVQPDFLPAWLLSAQVSYDKKSYEQALQLLVRYLNRFPEKLSANILLASTYLKLDQPHEALKLLNPYLRTGKADPQILTLAGEAYLQINDISAAEDMFSQASELVPESATLRMKLGTIRLAQGDLNAAIADLQGSSKLNPELIQADAVLIGYFLSEGKFDDALSATEVLQSKHPDHPLPYTLRARAEIGLRDNQSARQNLEKAISLNPDYLPALIQLSELDIAEGHVEIARKRFIEFLERNAENVPAMLAMAHFAIRGNDETGYVEWLEKASQADGRAFRPRLLLAEFYINKDSVEDALRIAREAHAADQDNVEALALLARVEQLAGDYSNARVLYQKLVKLDPNSALAYYNLSKVEAALGYVDGTRDALRKALSIEPLYARALVALVALELRTGRADVALRLAREFKARAPGSPLGSKLEGDALYASQRHTEAISAYKESLGIADDSLVAVKLHRATARSGDVGTADAVLLQWLEARPKDGFAHTYLAESLARRKLHDQAIEQYEIVAEMTPDDATILNNLANQYQLVDDPRARGTAEKAYALAPKNPAVTDTLGWILIQDQEYEKGLLLLEQAASTSPETAEIRYHFAHALSKVNQFERAREEIVALQSMALSPELKKNVQQLSNRLPIE